MSRVIPEKSLEFITLSDHVVNANNRGNIHLAVANFDRANKIKLAFPKLPNNFAPGYKFCMMKQYVGQIPGKKYTEDTNQATCQKCLDQARDWEYGVPKVTIEESFHLSKHSIGQITNWIPQSIQIVVSSEGINVVDDLTDEKISVNNIAKASILVAEKCFQPFSDKVVSQKNIFTKKIYDFDNGQFIVQGVNFDDKSQKFDGLILRSTKNKHLVNLTFKQLFNSGFHFEDGTPCGDYVKSRERLIESEIKDSMGLDFMELDL